VSKLSFAQNAAGLLAKQTVCDSQVEVEALLADIRNRKGVQVVSFLNKDAIVRAQGDPAFRKALLASDWLLRDGIGVKLMMDWAGMASGENLNGTDLIPRIIDGFHRATPLALLGTRDPRLSLARDRLATRGFTRIEMLDGFQPDQTYVDHLRASDARLVILAMGMPKQERVAMMLAADPVLAARDITVVNGGAILDFMSGDVARAPLWMRKTGLEWLYRFGREPLRLAPRFINTFSYLLKSKLRAGQVARALAETHQGTRT